MKSASDNSQFSLKKVRRAVVEHLVRQSGGPTPDPRDAIRLAKTHYGLTPREGRVGRFTARITRLERGGWALDFNPNTPKLDLVAAVWHELSELLCLSDDLVGFDNFSQEVYHESALSPIDRRHLCAIGVERFVWARLRQVPEVHAQLTEDRIRQVLLVRSMTAPSEPILPSIVREPWLDDEVQTDSCSVFL